MNIRFLKAATQHGSASLVVIAVAEVTGYFINRGLEDSVLKMGVKAVEEFVVFGQYVWLSIVLGYELWGASPWSTRSMKRPDNHG